MQISRGVYIGLGLGFASIGAHQIFTRYKPISRAEAQDIMKNEREEGIRLRCFSFEGRDRYFWSDCWLYDVDPSDYTSLRGQGVTVEDWSKVAKTTEELTEMGWTTADVAYKIARKCICPDSKEVSQK